MNRRQFLTASSLALGATQTLQSASAAQTEVPTQKPKPRLGISTYSYWHFKTQKVPIEHVIREAARLGAPAVDILHRQMDNEERGYLQQLKRTAFQNGVDLICLSIHQDFVDP